MLTVGLTQNSSTTSLTSHLGFALNWTKAKNTGDTLSCTWYDSPWERRSKAVKHLGTHTGERWSVKQLNVEKDVHTVPRTCQAGQLYKIACKTRKSAHWNASSCTPVFETLGHQVLAYKCELNINNIRNFECSHTSSQNTNFLYYCLNTCTMLPSNF